MAVTRTPTRKATRTKMMNSVVVKEVEHVVRAVISAVPFLVWFLCCSTVAFNWDTWTQRV